MQRFTVHGLPAAHDQARQQSELFWRHFHRLRLAQHLLSLQIEGDISVRQILRQQAGIDLGNTIAVDGSGLSRHNLISPATMMQVLQYIAQHDAELNFITMLPLAGHDGSLQYRAGLHAAGVDGKVSAKTGSLQGVYNLAGFITTASGQRMAFVQYLSGYAVEPADQRNRRIPLVRFESRLYKDIYQNN